MDNAERRTKMNEPTSGIDTIEGQAEKTEAEQTAAAMETVSAALQQSIEPDIQFISEIEPDWVPNWDGAEPPELSDMELNQVIENICNSKAEEFRMLGYEHVTGREVWECVSDKYPKLGTPKLHKIVNDILSLKVTSFMNWMTMSMYKSNPFK